MKWVQVQVRAGSGFILNSDVTHRPEGFSRALLATDNSLRDVTDKVQLKQTGMTIINNVIPVKALRQSGYPGQKI
jgi:hypothetical protein